MSPAIPAEASIQRVRVTALSHRTRTTTPHVAPMWGCEMTGTEGDDVLALLPGRSGHFLMESGLHADLWLDLDQLFVRPERLLPSARRLRDALAGDEPQVLCGPLLGGALLAQIVALTGGLDAVYTERTTWTPGALWSARYELPASLAGVVRGRRVAVVDDVVNAGSALRATIAAVRSAGGEVVGTAALLRLGDTAVPWLQEAGLTLHALAARDTALWPPSDCPLCRQGLPLHQ
jgi:orotate phosphoribosyltransferase